VTIVVDGWEVDVNRFEKKVGQFTIAIRQTPVDGAAFRWNVEATAIDGLTGADGVCRSLDEAKVMAERVAGLLGGLVGGP
jgi:hypothetical protein